MKNLEKKIALMLVFIASSVSAQIGVGTRTPDSDAMLEVKATNKGLLLPRVALVATTAVSPLANHVAGMTVYNTATAGDVTPGYYYNDGAKWVKLATGLVLDATASATGKIQLAGDLSGSATVPTVKDGAITSTKILDGTIAGVDIATGAVTSDKLSLGTASSGQVLKWDGSAWVPAADAGLTTTTVSNAIDSGTLTTRINGVVSEPVTLPVTADANATTNGIVRLAGDLSGLAEAPTVANLAINTAKLAANAVTTAKILDGTIVTDDIAAAAVTIAKIAATGTADATTFLRGDGAWSAVPVQVTAISTTEAELPTTIEAKKLYAIKGEFTADGNSALVTITKPAGMTGYYSITIYKDGTTFRREINSFDLNATNDNVSTGSGLFSEVYPSGTYSYVLEYFK